MTDCTHNIGFELRVLFKHRSEALTSKFCSTLTTMTVKDGKAAIESLSLELVLNHKLRTEKTLGLVH